MSQELYGKIIQDLRDRGEWESRQKVWQTMRHDGLRRSSPPWPGAADMHFPLGDTFVERHKPFYVQQLRSSEHIATFTSRKCEGAPFMSPIGQWFDFKVKKRSNFEEEIIYVIDTFLEASLCVVKTTWNVDAGRLEYEAIDPINIIVPKGTTNIQEADRVVHVIPLSVEAYKRRSEWSDKALAQIKGSDAAEANIEGYAREKYNRAGITKSDNEDEVVIWEVYTKESGGWEVETFSPVNPQVVVRKPYKLTYKHKQNPFTTFRYEIKDKGHYDNRGLIELCAPFEIAVNKNWNSQLDCTTLLTAPIFYSENPIPNTANLRAVPGQILPFKIGRAEFGGTPPAFEQQIQFLRQTAEYRVGMPDYGIGQSQGNNEPRTAREIDAIANVSGQNVDLRAYTFRLSLGQLFFQSYELLKQFDRDGLDFYAQGAYQNVPVEALDAEFDVEPCGSADGSTKEQRFQKAAALRTMLKDDPFVNQGELTKVLLEATDENLVKRLYQDPNEKARTEYEDELVLIPALREGAPIQPKPEQDQDARLSAIADYQISRQKMGIQPSPIEQGALMQRVQGHMMLLKPKDPNAYQQWEMRLQQSQEAQQPEAQAA